MILSQQYPCTTQLKQTTFNLTALALAMLLAPVAIASIPKGEMAMPLKPLSDWLRQTGKPSIARSRILEAMNLPAGDMPLRERGFKHEGERITHVCAISAVPGYEGLIFLAQVDESNGDATIWRTGLDGVLVSTVRFTKGIAERVPNERFRSGFDGEKFIFLTRMRIQPAPSATPTPAK
jgi:hypothetical protein